MRVTRSPDLVPYEAFRLLDGKNGTIHEGVFMVLSLVMPFLGALLDWQRLELGLNSTLLALVLPLQALIAIIIVALFACATTSILCPRITLAKVIISSPVKLHPCTT
jgi:hypothetical protein